MTEKQRNVSRVMVGLGLLVAVLFGDHAWQRYRYQRHACKALQSRVLDHPAYIRSDLVLESCETATFGMAPNRKYPNVEASRVTIFASSPPGKSPQRVAFSARIDENPTGWFVDDVQLVSSTQ
jgi:hypothetical protein